MKETKKGWVEIDEKGEIVIGNFGFKVYKRRMDILQEGFSHSEIARVLITKLT